MTEEPEAPQGLPAGEPVEKPIQNSSDTGAEKSATENSNETSQEKPEHEGSPEKPAKDDEAEKLSKRAAKAEALEKQIQYERRQHKRQMAELERRLQPALTPPTPAEERPQPTQHEDRESVERRVREQLENENKSAAWAKAGNAEFSDFNDRCNSVAELVGDRKDDFMNVILDMDDGHKVVAYLSDNPVEAMRIFDLPHRRMAIELGKLSAKGFEPKPAPQSAAPPPIKPIVGSGRAETDPSKMTTAEWMKWREKQPF